MRFNPSVLAAAASLVVTLGFSAVAAASTASITYTSFSATTTGGALTYAALDQYQSWNTIAQQNGGLAANVENDGNAPSFTANAYVASVSGANSVAYFGAGQTFSVLTSASATPISSTSYPNYARADANQSDSFKLSTAGAVTFTVGYTINLSAVGGNPIDSFSDAFASFTVENSSGEYFSPNLTVNSYENPNNSGTFSGSFNVTVDLAAGEIGYYTLQGTTESLASTLTAPVPEPSSWALMLAGIGLLTTFQHRRAKNR